MLLFIRPRVAHKPKEQEGKQRRGWRRSDTRSKQGQSKGGSSRGEEEATRARPNPQGGRREPADGGRTADGGRREADGRTEGRAGGRTDGWKAPKGTASAQRAKAKGGGHVPRRECPGHPSTRTPPCAPATELQEAKRQPKENGQGAQALPRQGATRTWNPKTGT